MRLLPLPLHLPVFRLEMRRIRWVQSSQNVRNHTLLIFAIVMLVSVLLWLVLVLPHRGLVRGFVVSDTVIRTLFFFSIAANLLLDVRCLMVTGTGGQYGATYWDLVQLSPQHTTDIVASLHSLAQVQMWRMTAIIISMRIAPVVLLLLHMVMVPYWTNTSYTMFDSLIDAFRIEPLLTLELMLGFVLFWAAFTLEPLWRMRAMTAVALAVRAYFADGMVVLLVGSAVTVGLWIVQAVIFTFIPLLALFVGGIWGNVIGQFLAVTIGILLSIRLIYVLYRRLKNTGLRYAAGALFRERQT